MTGFGMITGSLVTARWGAGRWGLAYTFGVFVAMAMLIVWALSPNVGVAVLTLYLASCGSGLFAATQSTLVLTTVSEEMRGRAMGLLSMAIGALPVGTLRARRGSTAARCPYCRHSDGPRWVSPA